MEMKTVEEKRERGGGRKREASRDAGGSHWRATEALGRPPRSLGLCDPSLE